VFSNVADPAGRASTFDDGARRSLWRVILMSAANVDAVTQARVRPCGVMRRSHTMLDELRSAIECESGQTMAEYAVVLGVITIAVVVTLGLLSTAISNTLNNVIASL
jgi:Flp pilus assembly pilin Flp